MGKSNITYINVDILAVPNSAFNMTFMDVLGNKTDVSNATVNVASIVGLLRYIIATGSTSAVLGALATAGHAGAVDEATTIMGYVKQLITASIARDTLLGTPAADVSADIAAIKAETTGIVVAQTAGLTQIATVVSADGSVTPWTQAAHRLFTITGVVKARVFAIVTETLVGAGTLEVGVAGATAGLIAQVADATDLAAGDVLANSGTATLVPLGQTNEFAIMSNTDIDVLVGTANITDGTMTFYVEWSPISVGATLVTAIWD